MPFITQGKTNLKYILIVVILAVIVGGGILGYYYSWIKELDIRLAQLELRLPEAKTPEGELLEEDIYKCEKDEDCISKRDRCCYCGAGGTMTVINKDYLEYWNNKLLEECQDKGCWAEVWPEMSQHWTCSAAPRCINKKCELVAKESPKPETSEETYNHAGKIVKIYQKEDKQYLDVNFMKFLLFVDKDGYPTETPTYTYGENDETGDCAPIADPICIVDNDKTINAYEVSEDIAIIRSSYPDTPIPYENLEEFLVNSPFFRIQIEDDIIKRMHQIYVP